MTITEGIRINKSWFTFDITRTC